MTNKVVDRHAITTSWVGIAVGIANGLNAGEISPGDLAELRRMHPTIPSAPCSGGWLQI